MSTPVPEKTSEELLASLFAKALDELGATDLLTTDSVPFVKRAIGHIDDLHSRLANFHSLVFSRSVRRRLEEIRGRLRFPGGAPAAHRELLALAEQLPREARE